MVSRFQQAVEHTKCDYCGTVVREMSSYWRVIYDCREPFSALDLCGTRCTLAWLGKTHSEPRQQVPS